MADGSMIPFEVQTGYGEALVAQCGFLSRPRVQGSPKNGIVEANEN